ncbi:hypothetical protein PIROE2DRAFT_69887 [Piromyces sp. E2]|nr:hypothetical protein PIROE2DRAFT_69887 [Piromyces sp. E2]|eukprot:OUM59212.1 hypothetical protein PIROE2DRAFT_69887 [Piromyces sp. E2]
MDKNELGTVYDSPLPTIKNSFGSTVNTNNIYNPESQLLNEMIKDNVSFNRRKSSVSMNSFMGDEHTDNEHDFNEDIYNYPFIQKIDELSSELNRGFVLESEEEDNKEDQKVGDSAHSELDTQSSLFTDNETQSEYSIESSTKFDTEPLKSRIWYYKKTPELDRHSVHPNDDLHSFSDDDDSSLVDGSAAAIRQLKLHHYVSTNNLKVNKKDSGAIVKRRQTIAHTKFRPRINPSRAFDYTHDINDIPLFSNKEFKTEAKANYYIADTSIDDYNTSLLLNIAGDASRKRRSQMASQRNRFSQAVVNENSSTITPPLSPNSFKKFSSNATAATTTTNTFSNVNNKKQPQLNTPLDLSSHLILKSENMYVNNDTSTIDSPTITDKTNVTANLQNPTPDATNNNTNQLFKVLLMAKDHLFSLGGKIKRTDSIKSSASRRSSIRKYQKKSKRHSIRSRKYSVRKNSLSQNISLHDLSEDEMTTISNITQETPLHTLNHKTSHSLHKKTSNPSQLRTVRKRSSGLTHSRNSSLVSASTRRSSIYSKTKIYQNDLSLNYSASNLSDSTGLEFNENKKYEESFDLDLQNNSKNDKPGVYGVCPDSYYSEYHEPIASSVDGKSSIFEDYDDVESIVTESDNGAISSFIHGGETFEVYDLRNKLNMQPLTASSLTSESPTISTIKNITVNGVSGGDRNRRKVPVNEKSTNVEKVRNEEEEEEEEEKSKSKPLKKLSSSSTIATNLSSESLTPTITNAIVNEKPGDSNVLTSEKSMDTNAFTSEKSVIPQIQGNAATVNEKGNGHTAMVNEKGNGHAAMVNEKGNDNTDTNTNNTEIIGDHSTVTGSVYGESKSVTASTTTLAPRFGGNFDNLFYRGMRQWDDETSSTYSRFNDAESKNPIEIASMPEGIRESVNYPTIKQIPLPYYRYGVYMYITNPVIVQTRTMMERMFSAHTIYTITVKLLRPNLPMYRNDSICTFTVHKRYRQFRSFYKEIHKKYKDTINDWPEFPKKTYFDRFDSDTIKKRAFAFSSLMSFISLHPLLYNCPVLLTFLELTGSMHNPLSTVGANVSQRQRQRQHPDGSVTIEKSSVPIEGKTIQFEGRNVAPSIPKIFGSLGRRQYPPGFYGQCQFPQSYFDSVNNNQTSPSNGANSLMQLKRRSMYETPYYNQEYYSSFGRPQLAKMRTAEFLKNRNSLYSNLSATDIERFKTATVNEPDSEACSSRSVRSVRSVRSGHTENTQTTPKLSSTEIQKNSSSTTAVKPPLAAVSPNAKASKIITTTKYGKIQKSLSSTKLDQKAISPSSSNTSTPKLKAVTTVSSEIQKTLESENSTPTNPNPPLQKTISSDTTVTIEQKNNPSPASTDTTSSSATAIPETIVLAKPLLNSPTTETIDNTTNTPTIDNTSSAKGKSASTSVITTTTATTMPSSSNPPPVIPRPRPRTRTPRNYPTIDELDCRPLSRYTHYQQMSEIPGFQYLISEFPKLRSHQNKRYSSIF